MCRQLFIKTSWFEMSWKSVQRFLGCFIRMDGPVKVSNLMRILKGWARAPKMDYLLSVFVQISVLAGIILICSRYSEDSEVHLTNIHRCIKCCVILHFHRNQQRPNIVHSPTLEEVPYVLTFYSLKPKM
jgi:hypothetical protein